MSTNPMAIKIRAKKLGLLMRDARLYTGKELAECAGYLGVSAERFEAYEMGDEAPSLPEIEVLAEFLGVPFDHFWGSTLLTKVASRRKNASVDVGQLVAIRQRIIGVLLKQSRVEKGFTLEALSELSGLPVSRLNSFELGEMPVALPELETLAELYDKPVEDFLDRKGPIGAKVEQQKMIDAMASLPQELQGFVCAPVNRPFLELAQRLSEMPVEKLRSVAEGLLEITL
jgi:transcriptional regulator with XRE-family HTH domain